MTTNRKVYTVSAEEYKSLYRVSFEGNRNKFRLRKKLKDGKLSHVGYYQTKEEAEGAITSAVGIALKEAFESNVVKLESKKSKHRKPSDLDNIIESLDGLKDQRIKKVHNFYSKVDEDYGVNFHTVENVHVAAVETYYTFVKTATTGYWAFFGI